MKRAHLFCICVLCLLLSVGFTTGCATSGGSAFSASKISEDQFDGFLIPGKTTQGEVRARYGKPDIDKPANYLEKTLGNSPTKTGRMKPGTFWQYQYSDSMLGPGKTLNLVFDERNLLRQYYTDKK